MKRLLALFCAALLAFSTPASSSSVDVWDPVTQTFKTASTAYPLPVTGAVVSGGIADLGPYTTANTVAYFLSQIAAGTATSSTLPTYGQANAASPSYSNASSNPLSLDLNGNLRVTEPVLTTGPTSFQQTTTTSAVALATNSYKLGIVITALTTNGGTVYVGGSGVTTGTGYALVAGQSISYAVNNSNLVYILGSDATQVVAVTGN